MKSVISIVSTQSRWRGAVTFWTAVALEGILTLLWLLRVPSEPGAAMWLGFSRLRLMLAGGVLAMTLFFAGLAWLAATRPRLWSGITRLTGRLSASPERTYTLLTGLCLLFSAGLALLIVMVSPGAVHSPALVVLLDRAGMVIAWIDLILAQLGLWVYFILVRQVQSEEGSANRLPQPLWGTLLVIAALVAAAAIHLYLGLVESENPWLSQVSFFLFLAAPLTWVTIQLVRRREVAWVFNFWAAVLLLGGAFVWIWFVNAGEGLYSFHDWAEISLPRLIVIQNALHQGELPLHISVGPALLGFTDRYMGVPDLLLAPQVLLLKWMEIGPFLITNLLLTYLAGFMGWIVFARRYQLSIVAFSLLFLLFNFNGHIAAQMAVGHYIWATAYFLLPWLIVLLFRLLDGDTGWKWVLQTAVLLFLILLHGGYHYLIYALALLGLIAITIPRQFGLMVKTIGFTVLLCAVRLFPLATNLSEFQMNIGYLDGFRSVFRIVESLVQVSPPHFSTSFTNLAVKVGTWELTYYLGLIGAGLLAVFGISAAIQNRANPYRLLLLPAFGLLLFSLDGVYRNLLILLPVPPFSGERVAARFFLLALLIVLALAGYSFQRWYEKQKPTPLFHVVCAATGLLLAHDLWQNLRYWQVEQAARIFPYETIDPMLLTITNHTDPAYITALGLGAAVSVTTLAVLLFLTWRGRRHNAQIPG